MGVRNYLVEGGSTTGKTAVCAQLRRRGYEAVNGDTELAYQGDPGTGVPLGQPVTGAAAHRYHVWNESAVRDLVADSSAPVTFLCGGSRNRSAFEDLFDGIFVLRIDAATLRRRLAARPHDEFGARDDERELILRLHHTGEDDPAAAIDIDATVPLVDVVDEILRHVTPG